MEITQWIQIILSLAMFAVTAVLAWATWKYMRFTKRMADAMETQTAIMTEGYERNIAPICRPDFISNATNDEETKIRFAILNYGKEIFSVIKVNTKIWNVDNPQAILQQHEQNENIVVPPMPHSPEVIINIRLNPEISRFFPDRERKIKYESIFIVKDVRDREHSFPAGMRSLF